MQESKVVYGNFLPPYIVGPLVKKSEVMLANSTQSIPRNFEEIAQFIEFEEYWKEAEEHMRALIKSTRIPASYLDNE